MGVWPAHGRSSDWLVGRSLEVTILSLLVPAGLGSIAGGQHAVNFWWGLQYLQNSSQDMAQNITSSPCMCVCAKSLQSCLTLRDPMDCSLPGSSVHGILQERMQEWVASSCSRGSSQPRDRTRVSCMASGFFTPGATWEPPVALEGDRKALGLFNG